MCNLHLKFRPGVFCIRHTGLFKIGYGIRYKGLFEIEYTAYRAFLKFCSRYKEQFPGSVTS